MMDMTHRQIAEAVAAVGGTTVSRLGLRLDRVVVRVLDRLRRGVDGKPRADWGVVLTLTAPLHAPNKLVKVMEQEIAALLQDGCIGAERSVVLHGGRARLRLVEHAAAPGCGLLGFVHNPDVDPAMIMDLAERWLQTRA